MAEEDNAAPHVPSEEEIAPVLADILKGSDMDNTTLRIIMDILAEQFNCDKDVLKDRKDFVRREIEKYLENEWQPPVPDNDKKASKRKSKAKSKSKQVVEVEDHDEEEVEEDEDDGGDEEYLSDEEVGGTKKRRKKKVASNGGARMGVKGHQVALTNLEKGVVLAQPLADFLGIRVDGRTKVAKKITTYVKENKLQDKSDGRKIHCDDKLQALFDVKEMTFFNVNKMLALLFTKRSDVTDAELIELLDKYDEEARIEKQRVYDEKVANGEPVGKMRTTAKAGKKQKADDGAEKPKRKMPDYRLSSTLAEICNVEVSTRSNVVKQLWVYIREHKLSSGGKIRPDAKLKQITGDDVEEMGNFEINRYISAHLTKL